MADVKRELDMNGWIKYIVSTDKAAVDYIVSKAENGYSSYVISLEKGLTPAHLSGTYTTPDKALKALLKHIEVMKVSRSVRRDADYAERQENRKNKLNGTTKLHTDNKGKVQQGASD